MRAKGFYCFFLMLLGFAAAAQAQDALERDPGYVDFQRLDRWFDAEPRLEVNVKGALLRLVAEASREEDPELAVLLNRLKAIQVRGFPLPAAQLGDVGRRTAEMARRLEGEGWETVARVREEEERVDMFLKMRGDNIAGLMVMVVDPDEEETIFVNIVGDIDPAQIGRIGRKFNIDPLSTPISTQQPRP